MFTDFGIDNVTSTESKLTGSISTPTTDPISTPFACTGLDGLSPSTLAYFTRKELSLFRIFCPCKNL